MLDIVRFDNGCWGYSKIEDRISNLRAKELISAEIASKLKDRKLESVHGMFCASPKIGVFLDVLRNRHWFSTKQSPDLRNKMSHLLSNLFKNHTKSTIALELRISWMFDQIRE